MQADPRDAGDAGPGVPSQGRDLSQRQMCSARPSLPRAVLVRARSPARGHRVASTARLGDSTQATKGSSAWPWRTVAREGRRNADMGKDSPCILSLRHASASSPHHHRPASQSRHSSPPALADRLESDIMAIIGRQTPDSKRPFVGSVGRVAWGDPRATIYLMFMKEVTV